MRSAVLVVPTGGAKRRRHPTPPPAKGRAARAAPLEHENCPNNGKRWVRAGGRGRDDAWTPPVPNSDERAGVRQHEMHCRDGAEQHVANSDGVVLGMSSRGPRRSTPNVALSGGRRPSA